MAMMFSYEDYINTKKIVLKNGSHSTDHEVQIWELERLLHKWYITNWASKINEVSCINSCIK